MPRKDQATKRIGQKAIADYLEKKLPEESETIYEINELPLYFEKGTIFTFGEINSTEFTHSFHPYPAKFVPQIPRWAISYAKLDSGDLILDPFCGCGTTLVEACLRGFNSCGIDVDPLARLLTAVKCTPLHHKDPALLFNDLDSLMQTIRRESSEIRFEGQPDVMLHYNWRYWFDEEVMKLLIRIKRGIRSYDSPFADSQAERQAVRSFFLVCLSAIVKKVSYLDEEQIKVKRSDRKFKQGVPSPIRMFEETCKKRVKCMIDFTNRMKQHLRVTAKAIYIDLPSGEQAISRVLLEKAVQFISKGKVIEGPADYRRSVGDERPAYAWAILRDMGFV